MKKIDMSETAVSQRLRQVDQLHELCLSLMKAKPIDKERAVLLRENIRNRNLKAEHESSISKEIRRA